MTLVIALPPFLGLLRTVPGLCLWGGGNLFAMRFVWAQVHSRPALTAGLGPWSAGLTLVALAMDVHFIQRIMASQRIQPD